MTLVERAAAYVLSGDANRNALRHQRPERERLSHAIIKRQFPGAHLLALLQQLFDLGMDVKAFWIRNQTVGKLLKPIFRHSRGDFILRAVAAAHESIPVLREYAQ